MYRVAAGIFCLSITCLLVMPVAAVSEAGGVVVASVEENSAGAEAGLKVGDVLQTWEVHDSKDDHSRGELSSPWQFLKLEQEYALGLSVDVRGQRDGKEIVFSLTSPKKWGTVIHPILPSTQHEELVEGLESIASGAHEKGIEILKRLAGEAERTPSGESSFFYYLGSIELEKAGALEESIAILEEALKTGPDEGCAGLIHSRLAKECMIQGRFDDAIVHAEQALALDSKVGTGQGLALVKILTSLGTARLRLLLIDEADEVNRQAFEICSKIAPESLTMASIKNGLGVTAFRRGRLDVAKKYFVEVSQLYQSLDPLDVGAGSVAHNLGGICMTRGELDEANTYYLRALKIRQAHESESIVVADSLIGLGIVAMRRGNLDEAENYAGHAVAIYHHIAPGGMSESYGLELRGGIAWENSDLARAEKYFRQVFEIRRKISSNTSMNAITLTNLGAVALERGNLAKAEDYLHHALEIQEKIMPGSLELSLILHNLGTIMWTRDDYDGAESYFRRTLEIREEQAPDSVYVAETYTNMAGLYRDLGRNAEAEEFVMKALACWRAVGPDGLNVALLLGNLANWKAEDGELEEAEKLAVESLRIREELAPGSSAHAAALQGMGMLTARLRQPERAESYYRKALEIFENIGVENRVRVDTWYMLGNLLRETGRKEEALDAYTHAISELENFVGSLGGSEDSHTNFRAIHHDMYQSMIDLLVEMKLETRAFGMLERSRARGFLNMLGERELVFSADIPEELDRERRIVRAGIEKEMVELSELSDDETDQREELRQKLQSGRVRLSEIHEEIRSKAPRLASLTAPEPLDLQQSVSVLDAGTLALCYSVGQEKTQLFILGPGPGAFRVVTLDIGEEMLRRKIRRLRNALTDPASGMDTVHRISRALGRILLSAAENDIARADRILFVPDGPLYEIPFSVLPTPGSSEYLVLSKPLSQVASLTVFGQLKAESGKHSSRRIVAMGAPMYPGPEQERAENLLTAYTRGEPLSPLAFSRTAVVGLRTLFPETSTIWLGADATEERARGIGKSADIVHFACHALVDENHPLESALILSIPPAPEEDAQNGLLQAWEVIESMRLDAELVVLSACRTALGREMAGEGIVGLTRAFQFAGARAVLASLWPVADRSTAGLMEGFYKNLAAGLTADTALQDAQIELATHPVDIGNGEMVDFTHPYYWAAFQLSGNWNLN